MQQLVSVRVEKLRDVIQAGLVKIGDSGVFSKAVGKLKNLSSALFQHLDSPQFREQAGRISNSLGRLMDNLGRMIVEFLARISGTKGGADTVVGMATSALEVVANLSEGLSAIGRNVGTFFHGLGSIIDKAVGKVDQLIAAIQGFSVAQNLVPGELLSGLKDAGVGVAEQKARLAIEVGKRYGIHGADIDHVATNDLSPGDNGFGWMGKFFLAAKHASYRYIASGDDAQKASLAGMDYAYGIQPVPRAKGIKDPAQQLLLSKVATQIDTLTPEDLANPDRANLKLYEQLRSSGLLEKLQAGARKRAASRQSRWTSPRTVDTPQGRITPARWSIHGT